MKLHPFIAGTFGVIGFALSILAGLIADNSIDSILINATLFAALCYAVGYIVGLIASQISSEHSQRLAKKVADRDAADEQKRLETEAALEAEAANNPATQIPTSPTPVPAKT